MSPLLIAGRLTPPNVRLLEAARGLGAQARLLPPELAERRARPNETVLGRVDIRPGLDGVEPGLESLRRLEEAGVEVLNRADALLAAHDKLETATAAPRSGAAASVDAARAAGWRAARHRRSGRAQAAVRQLGHGCRALRHQEGVAAGVRAALDAAVVPCARRARPGAAAAARGRPARARRLRRGGRGDQPPGGARGVAHERRARGNACPRRAAAAGPPAGGGGCGGDRRRLRRRRPAPDPRRLRRARAERLRRLHRRLLAAALAMSSRTRSSRCSSPTWQSSRSGSAPPRTSSPSSADMGEICQVARLEGPRLRAFLFRRGERGGSLSTRCVAADMRGSGPHDRVCELRSGAAL